MIIRKECEKDFEIINNLVKNAFKTAKVSNGKEQDFVNELRNSEDYIPELALVAIDNNFILGHIMLTKTYIFDKDKNFETLFLGPVSVDLKYINKGIGSKLINVCLEKALDLGYGSVVLVGDPDYYSRFGFVSSTNFGIKHIMDIPEQFVLAKELFPNSLNGCKGLIKR